MGRLINLHFIHFYLFCYRERLLRSVEKSKMGVGITINFRYFPPMPVHYDYFTFYLSVLLSIFNEFSGLVILPSSHFTDKCGLGQHICDHDMCLLPEKVCDAKTDCSDGTDELHCRHIRMFCFLFHFFGSLRTFDLLLLSSEDNLMMNCLPVCLSMFMIRSSTGSCGVGVTNVRGKRR